MNEGDGRSAGPPGGPALSCPPCGHRQEESQQVYLQGTDTLPFSPLPDWQAPPQSRKASCGGPLSPCRRRPPGGDAPVNTDATFQKHTHCEKHTTVTRSAREQVWKRGRKPAPSISLFTKVLQAKMGAHKRFAR